MEDDRPALYPLRFREILRDYSFGNRWIADALAKQGLPANHPLSETWEVCDRRKDSSEIVNGPLAGRTLREAIKLCGRDLLGASVAGRFGSRFPLLVKFLDVTHALAEQCHPDDALTSGWQLPDSFGKTEAWYVLKAAPGASVFCGSRPGITREALFEAILAGRSRDCMTEYPVRAGDAFLLYAGTMHYSAGGLLLYEIMQSSDVYVGLGKPPEDLPRQKREERAERGVEAVHLEDGFDCRIAPVAIDLGANRRTFLFACDKFAVERLDVAEPMALELSGERFYILTVIEGEVNVACAAGQERLVPGNTCLLPACLGRVEVSPIAPAAVLKASVPDLAADVIEPLRARGVGDDAIRGLGGRTRLNCLDELL